MWRGSGSVWGLSLCCCYCRFCWTLGQVGDGCGKPRRVEDDGVPGWGRATVRPVILLSENNERIPGSPTVMDGGGVVLLPLDLQI